MAKERKNADSMNKSSLQIYKNEISQRQLNKLAKTGIHKKILQQTFQNSRPAIERLVLESRHNPVSFFPQKDFKLFAK